MFGREVGKQFCEVVPKSLPTRTYFPGRERERERKDTTAGEAHMH
jgi:hypothetical protein